MPQIPAVFVVDCLVKTLHRVCTNRTYWTLNNGPPTTAIQMNQAADEFNVWFKDVYRAVLSPAVSWMGCKTYWMHPLSELEGKSTDGPQAGLLTGDPLPDETCLCIQRRTGKRGRENRGRIFVSGISEALQVSGSVVVTSYAACKSLELKFQDAGPTLATSGLGATTPLHWDRKNNSLELVTDARAMTGLVSRRDRRRPLVTVPI